MIKKTMMRSIHLTLLTASLLLAACQSDTNVTSKEAEKHTRTEKADMEASKNEKIDFQNRAHELVYSMTQAAGDYDDLREKKDVTYTYTYTTPDGRTDRVEEKYIFDGEQSYGAYRQHERTLPDLEGLIEQGYDGTTFWLRHDGAYLDDEAMMKRVVFNRKTNFYWFTMFQKLMDPGLNYEYLKEENRDGKQYDVVKVTFDSSNGKPTDIYQLWIDKKTSLVDQFLFTVADFGVMETPKLMQVEYETVDGIALPTKRRYTNGDWEGNNVDEKWVDVRWKDIRFDNGLSESIFEKSPIDLH